MTSPHPDLTAAERAEIRERADKATPGPWVADHLDPKSPSWVEISQKCAVAQVFDGTNGSVATAWGDGNTGPAHPQQVPNADFIAHARTDVPRLLSALDAADQRERALTDENMCDACAGGHPISGRPCMCGGSGKMSDAARYLREQLVAADQRVRDQSLEIASYRAALEDIVVDCDALMKHADERLHGAVLGIRAVSDNALRGYADRHVMLPKTDGA